MSHKGSLKGDPRSEKCQTSFETRFVIDDCRSCGDGRLARPSRAKLSSCAWLRQRRTRRALSYLRTLSGVVIPSKAKESALCGGWQNPHFGVEERLLSFQPPAPAPRNPANPAPAPAAAAPSPADVAPPPRLPPNRPAPSIPPPAPPRRDPAN